MFEEYKNLKENYSVEYQDNYQINLNEKQANIDDFKETIEEKKQQVTELERFKAQNNSCIQVLWNENKNEVLQDLLERMVSMVQAKKGKEESRRLHKEPHLQNENENVLQKLEIYLPSWRKRKD